MTELLPISVGNLCAFRATDKIEKDDIARMANHLQHIIEAHGKARLYFEMHDFHGWTASAFWSDVKFDTQHADDFTHIAMVGEKGWQEWMTKFMKPFTSAEVKFFKTQDKADAINWLNE